MFPVLLTLGPVQIESYYFFWGAALCVMVVWTRLRAARVYGIGYNDATDVLIWVIFGVFAGATIGGYLDHWTRYASSPIELLYFWKSGLSSGPGFIGGGLAGLYKLRDRSISIDRFAESAALPCAALLFIGRWGCFFNGCCEGIRTNSAFGVAFPQGHGIKVFPTQLFESFAALLIGICLVIIEKQLRRKNWDASRGALAWPAFLILYGAYRFVYDFLRAGDRIFGLRVGQYTGALAFIIGVLWLVRSYKNYRADAARHV
jgi:phosphatidylglycerol:prolipoprotein diacylglycerol transferase